MTNNRLLHLFRSAQRYRCVPEYAGCNVFGIEPFDREMLEERQIIKPGERRKRLSDRLEARAASENPNPLRQNEAFLGLQESNEFLDPPGGDGPYFIAE